MESECVGWVKRMRNPPQRLESNVECIIFYEEILGRDNFIARPPTEMPPDIPESGLDDVLYPGSGLRDLIDITLPSLFEDVAHSSSRL